MDNATTKTRMELLSEAAELYLVAARRADEAADAYDTHPAQDTERELKVAGRERHNAERRLLNVACGEGWLPQCCTCGEVLEAPGAPGGVPLVRIEDDPGEYCPECAAYVRSEQGIRSAS